MRKWRQEATQSTMGGGGVTIALFHNRTSAYLKQFLIVIKLLYSKIVVVIGYENIKITFYV